MNDVVISVEGLGKRYALSHQHRPDSIKTWLRAMVRQYGSASRSRQPIEEFWALRDVHLQVRHGDCLALVGANGSGKSTLLKVLSRIIPPSRGKVQIRGRVVSLLEVGAGFHPELTGRENIFLNGAILGCPESVLRKRFDEIVDFSGVERFLDTPVKHFSSGMYVRLAYSVAAHVDSDIQIVDEVLSVGDSAFQEKCLERISNYILAGKTVIFVSHNEELVASLATRIARLESGLLAEVPLPVVEHEEKDEEEEDEASVSAFPAQTEDLNLTDAWEGCDGSDVFQLRVTYANPGRGTRAFSHEPLIIGFRGSLLQPVDQLIAAIEIRSHCGNPLAYSAYDDMLLPPDQTVAPGDFSWELTIPPNTLAEGIYDFVFDIGINNIQRLVNEDCKLRIEVTNTSGYGQRHPTEAWHNLLRPAWTWKRSDNSGTPL